MTRWGQGGTESDSAVDDSVLVVRAASGDEGAWEVLVDRYWEIAYSVAWRMVDRHEDAQDVAQEALLVCLRQLRAWFMKVAWTRAINHHRREFLRRTEPIPRGAACTRTLSPEQAAERSDFLQALGDGLAALPDERRRAFLMHDVEGWKHREIAEQLGLRSGTARSHVSLARRALRSSLAAYEPTSCT